MSTTKEDIRRWLQDAKAEGATHLIVVCDEFDYEDYPVRVNPGESAQKISDEYDKKSMQRVMEVYALHLDWEKQLKEHQSFHYENEEEK